MARNRADLRPKLLRQGKKPPCIQGRTLAMRKLREEDKDGCMRINVIEELIREIQQEEAMSKLQSKQKRYNDLDDTNHNFVMQKIVEEMQDFPYEVQNFENNVQNFESQV
ncbi:hypothetical protein PIB30_085434 [Stylosanthes scabra]|uniref:Uncharacterized protein n=1 Tax=Stylosanthes scabra TaxID=79078 RepID=A0ABU6YQI0_9FABA|nr:hypothetical protein [Stylosanthes scabra]